MKLIDADAKAARNRANSHDSMATVTIRNEAAAAGEPILLDLVRPGGTWRMDDCRGAGGSLRNHLSGEPLRSGTRLNRNPERPI